jgi:hypothetical protein
VDSADQIQVFVPEFYEEFFRNTPLVGQQFSLQSTQHIGEWRAVICVAGRDLDGHQFALICKSWTNKPERFKLNPIHHMPGLNT